jgi:adenylosuccinate synthase
MSRQQITQVVIGAQFGDEGKGRVMDQYAAALGGDGIVIRFNGGAQAGHTVATPDGLRHVFSHVGSGAFAGAATFLSRFFVSNPILFLKEQKTLAALGVRPTVLIDPDSPVTTPYDMMINQIVEQERGADRHGSCGIGFGETLERSLSPRYALTVRDLADSARLATRLDAIRRDYAPVRLARLGFDGAYAQHGDWFSSDAILERFMADADCFLAAIRVADLRTATQDRMALFEGAQGLLLDQDRGFFPHVTRSNTGLRNVLTLAAELGLERLDVSYVTRAYLTRHGAGPLPHEVVNPPYPGIHDATNVPNAYQGSLRFGWLDLNLLQRAIAEDLSDARHFPQFTVSARLAITCLDQLGDKPVRYYQDGGCHEARMEPFIAAVAETVGIENLLLSFGAARNASEVVNRALTA